MKHRSRFLILASIVLAASSLVACAGAPSAATEESLVGVWALDQEFDSPEQPFIALSEDGTWIASDGCNQVRGTWELGEDGSLVTTSGPSTLMACEGAQLPLAMAQAESVIVAGDSLTLVSSGGSTRTTLVRSTDPAIGPQGLPTGRWIESTDDGAPYLDFSADGTLSGNDGCNSMGGGTWEVADDGAILLTLGASTQMFCEGVDTWLSMASKGRIVAQVMTLEDLAGTVLGQLVAE